jgi:hypothetical protein
MHKRKMRENKLQEEAAAILYSENTLFRFKPGSGMLRP